MGAYLSLIGRRRGSGGGGRLFEAGRLLTFSAFRMGAYLRWALIRGWALIRINTVTKEFKKYQVIFPWGYSTKKLMFIRGGSPPPPEVQPLTLLYTISHEKGTPLYTFY